MKLLALLLISILPLSSFAVENNELEKRIEILADEINQLKAYQMSINKNESVFGLGRSASKVYHIPQGLSIGGYGEMTYKHYRAENENGDPIDKDPMSEVLRNIIYVGYKFNDKWLINMELEIEHVSQVYTEFMYLDYLHSDAINFRAGLMLHPIGFLNELHEPTVYPGVFRPEVESKIIPSTWRAMGIGILGNLSEKTSYKLYLMNGMNAQGFKDGSLRGGRTRGGQYNDNQDSKEDKANNQRTTNGILVWRLDHQLTNHLSLGTSGLIGKANGQNEDLDQTMIELHAEYIKGVHHFRFMAVENRFANADDWNEATYTDPDTNTTATNNPVNHAAQGAYVEYRYSINANNGDRYVPFFRYEMINLQSDRADAFTQKDELESTHLTVGLNYFPLDRVVFKVDYTMNKNKDETGIDVFAAGIGYNF